MTRTSGNPRATEAEWNAEILRLTTFHPSGVLANTQGWWKALTNEEPGSIVNKPKGGERAEVGRYEGWPFALQVQPQPEGRVDWIAGGPGETTENSETLRLPIRLPLFLDPMRRWLQTNCPRTKRLAFGAILQLDVGNRSEGYRTLSNYLDFDLSEDAWDFMYQINRKRISRVVKGLSINRLTRWSVGSFQRATFRIASSDCPVEAEVGQQTYHCRLELDINTAPEFPDLLPQGQLAALLDEMQQMSLEIVRDGDVS